MGPRLPVILQDEATECGLACLAMIAAYFGHKEDLRSLRRRFPTSTRGTTLRQLMVIAGSLGLDGRPVRADVDRLKYLRDPTLLHWNMNHFVVFKCVEHGKYVIHDPAVGIRRLSLADISKYFTGITLELTPNPQFTTGSSPNRISLRAVLGQVRGWRKSVALVLTFAIALEISLAIGPLVVQWMIDNILLTGDQAALSIICFGLSVTIIVQSSLTLARGLTTLFLSASFKTQWLGNVFGYLLRLPVEYFEKRSFGSIASRFDSVQSIQRTLSSSFVDGVLDGLIALGISVLMAIYDIRLAALALVAVALYSVCRISMYRLARRASESFLIESGQQQSILVETLRGIRTIKLFARESERRTRWVNAVVASTNAQLINDRLAILAKSAYAFIFGLQSVLILWIGSRDVLAAKLSLGMLVAFIAYKEQFNVRVAQLVDRIFDTTLLGVQVQRLSDILLSPIVDSNEPRRPTTFDPDCALELRQVSFRYSAADPLILNGVNLKVGCGECLAIVGASGSGKSTLVKLIAGLLSPISGDVFIQATGARHNNKGRSTPVSFVLQDDTLFSGTIGENIHFFDNDADESRVVECARLACIHEDIARMPMGYQSLIGEMGDALSGGQRQRLLLARAMYGAPDILVLDEATSHLDIPTERQIAASLKELSITRIIVAHRPETVAIADRRVLCEGGTIREIRAPSDTDCPAEKPLSGIDGKARQDLRGLMKTMEDPQKEEKRTIW